MDVIDDKMENKLKSQKTDGSDGEIVDSSDEAQTNNFQNENMISNKEEFSLISDRQMEQLDYDEDVDGVGLTEVDKVELDEVKNPTIKKELSEGEIESSDEENGLNKTPPVEVEDGEMPEPACGDYSLFDDECSFPLPLATDQRPTYECRLGESAWAIGLRNKAEMKKKSTQRKINDPDFVRKRDDIRLDPSLSNDIDIQVDEKFLGDDVISFNPLEDEDEFATPKLEEVSRIKESRAIDQLRAIRPLMAPESLINPPRMMYRPLAPPYGRDLPPLHPRFAPHRGRSPPSLPSRHPARHLSPSGGHLRHHTERAAHHDRDYRDRHVIDRDYRASDARLMPPEEGAKERFGNGRRIRELPGNAEAGGANNAWMDPWVREGRSGNRKKQQEVQRSSSSSSESSVSSKRSSASSSSGSDSSSSGSSSSSRSSSASSDSSTSSTRKKSATRKAPSGGNRVVTKMTKNRVKTNPEATGKRSVKIKKKREASSSSEFSRSDSEPHSPRLRKVKTRASGSSSSSSSGSGSSSSGSSEESEEEKKTKTANRKVSIIGWKQSPQPKPTNKLTGHHLVDQDRRRKVPKMSSQQYAKNSRSSKSNSMLQRQQMIKQQIKAVETEIKRKKAKLS